MVAFHSVNASTQSRIAGVPSIIASAPAENVCEAHNTQATNREIQDYVIKVLTGISAAPKQLAAMRP
jgi:uncharacterized protein YcgI (DUF1989 family)